MSVVRVLFLGTPDFARFHLENLLKDSHFKVVGVVSQPDRPSGRKLQLTPSPVKQLALENNVPVFTPEKASSSDFIETVRGLNAEAAVVVAYGQILSQAFLDLFPKRIVNVHGSLLPKWRGAAPIQRSIMAGDSETGVCLQVMVKKLDAGDVIGLRKIPVSNSMTALELHEAMKPLGADLLAVDFMDYLRGNLGPIEQDESKVTYATKIDKAESQIEWSQSAETIHNKIRGLAMGPVAFSKLNGKILKIHRTQVVDAKGQPGEVLDRAPGKEMVVVCGKGALSLLEVQPEGKTRQAIGEYLKGYPIKKGDRLG